MRAIIFIIIIIVQIIVLVAFNAVPALQRPPESAASDALRKISRILLLTDLSIWTESRYTRHPSQADLFSSFQDCPAAMEHFPAGSLAGPPPQLQTTEARIRPDKRP